MYVDERLIYTESEVAPVRKALLREYKKFLRHLVDSGIPLPKKYSEKADLVLAQLLQLKIDVSMTTVLRLRLNRNEEVLQRLRVENS